MYSMLVQKIILLLALIGITSFMSVQADDAESQASDDSSEFSVMSALSEHNLHNLKDERWNFYSQGTYITSYKDAFPAAYTNLNGSTNSLTPNAERSFTATVTGYLGLKAWQGAEFYAAPEMVSELPLSGLKGLGGSIQNFELQKNGTESSTWYLPRAFYRQTLALGGTPVEMQSGAMQLGGSTTSRRFVFTGGLFSILDIFDKNTYAANLRQQFFNMAFMTNAAYDFAADARGYTTGFAGEFYFDEWAFRFARIAGPKDPNQLLTNLDLLNFYGDQIELEHQHKLFGQSGAVRILGYRNRENMGSWTDAIAAFKVDPTKNAVNCTGFNYDSLNASAPDLCWARKPNIKMGIGINMEQKVSEDLGLFFRGMVSDGKTEVFSYTSSDQSISLGAQIKGLRWGRTKDSVGIGYAESWISKGHVAYLNMGGIDGFIGDGKINYRSEKVMDIYYQFHAFQATWLSIDYQYIANPAYNADRGPVDMYSGRVHFEF